jgi:hypothetical protein
MTTRLILPVELLDDKQSEEARQEFQEVCDCFTIAVQLEEDVAPSKRQLEEDDYHGISFGLVRADVREWVEERRLDVRFSLAFHLDKEDKAVFWCAIDLDDKGRRAHFSPTLMAEFQDDSQALLFKLTWGGDA